jgi:AcrR family transcriptional regulator
MPTGPDPTTEITGLRRRPRQARSRARVKRLLDAAETVLASEGYDALTVRRLAAEAEVPIGTLYQFFPDKQAVLDTLAHRYLDEFIAVLTELVSRAEQERWDDPVRILVETFAEAYRSRPAYVAIWTSRQLSPQLRLADEENNATIADGVRRVLLAQFDLTDGPDLRRACQVAVKTGDALLRYAFQDSNGGDPQVLVELLRIQQLYLTDLLDRHGTGGPRQPSR